MPKPLTAAELMKRIEAAEVEYIAGWLAMNPIADADTDGLVAMVAALRARRTIRQLTTLPGVPPRRIGL